MRRWRSRRTRSRWCRAWYEFRLPASAARFRRTRRAQAAREARPAGGGSRTSPKSNGLAEDLLEEREGARVLALPQPEERGAHDLGLPAGPNDPNQRGDALVCWTLGQGEHRLLPHLELTPAVMHDRIEPPRGFHAGGLPQPED